MHSYEDVILRWCCSGPMSCEGMHGGSSGCLQSIFRSRWHTCYAGIVKGIMPTRLSILPLYFQLLVHIGAKNSVGSGWLDECEEGPLMVVLNSFLYGLGN